MLQPVYLGHLKRALYFIWAGMILIFCASFGSALAGQIDHIDKLTSGWQFIRGSLGGPSEVWAIEPRDSIAWQAVNLPHCFNARDAVDPDTPYYQGPGWYRLLLAVNNPYPQGRTLLRFEGAGQKTDVFIHDQKVGSHVGGYDEFSVDITAGVEAFHHHEPSKPQRFLGKIPLTVRCDNSPDLDTIPSQRSDFVIYGGLYREVECVYVPAVSLERVHVLAHPDGKGAAQLTVAGRLYNPTGRTDELSFDLLVTAPDGTSLLKQNVRLAPWKGQHKLFTVLLPKAVMWSPSNPALYKCEVALMTAGGTQNIVEWFGVRSFEFVDHGPFKLNGERLLLRGTSFQQDHAGVGAAMTDGMIRQEFQMIKAMGANFVRLGHHQQSQLVLDLCDELGLLVWEEIPWCRGGVGGEHYRQQARDMLTAMIDQHYNHPAVIIWGLGNENDWFGDFETSDQKTQVRAFMGALNALAHQLDASRCTAARRCDFCKDIVDVYSPSTWAGWYRAQLEDYQKLARHEFEGVNHFFQAEWGADAHAGRHSETPDVLVPNYQSGDLRSPPGRDWSETYFCDLIDWHLKEQETMPWLTGSAQWNFKDFATPLRPEGAIPLVNEKGLVERDFTPKEAYYVFQSYWSDQTMAHIYGHSWPTRWGTPGERRTVKVYSNCETAELFVNGISVGTKKRNSQDFPAAGLHWEVRFNQGRNELKVVAHKGGREITDRLSVAYETRRWGRPEKLLLQETMRVGDVATVTATLVDANGVPCLDSLAPVAFQIAGDGYLIDDLGTTTGSRKVQLSNGRALIRAQLNHGVSVISVASPGIPTAFRTINGIR
ncbi:MAG TPA: glycoside hydrolase family 2 TIM barrel-domain containing protein [Opitutaceae bacterium]|nr:glycoside hydrolase family 2 TIM barrel-domain containing protein [Opitutaceae bacterium]